MFHREIMRGDMKVFEIKNQLFSDYLIKFILKVL